MNAPNRLEKLEVAYLSLTALAPNSYNPNHQTPAEFDLLLKSIESEGFTQPIVVLPEDENGNYTIVDGEHRWRAATKLGLKKIPAVIAPMSEAQARIATLRHNRARGREDEELAANVLQELAQLNALDWAQEALNLSDQEIKRILHDVETLAHAQTLPPPPDLTATAELPHAQPTPTPEEAPTRPETPRSKAREPSLPPSPPNPNPTPQEPDQSLYRLMVFYGQEDAPLLRRILDPNPSEKILELCRREKARRAKELQP